MINGAYYVRVQVEEDCEGAVWVPEDPDADPQAEVVVRAHWDLLEGTPSMGTGNPGTATVIRIGEVSVLSDPSAEILEAHRGPVIPETADAAEVLVGSQVTQIDSPWLAAEPSRISALLSSVPHFPARAIYVNGRLWHRLDAGWRDAPEDRYDDECLRRLGGGVVPDSVAIAALEGLLPQGTTLHPQPGSSSAAGDAEPERFVLIPGTAPEQPLVAAVTQAALKSTREVRPALVCRMKVGEAVRFGVRVAGDISEVCRSLGLPGWLEVRLGEQEAAGWWRTPVGRPCESWASPRQPPHNFPHPISVHG